MKRPSSSIQSSEFGLVAWLEATRIVLPLKGVECRFEVTGALASVELDQIYHQDADRPLDCTYTFPLPAGAAVYRCELHVNGRVVRAKVEEKETARRIYREQKAAGHRATLVECERENLFTLSLGNVQPEDLIVVRFAWFQVLVRTGDELRLMVPTCPGVRYIPGRPLLRGQSGRGISGDTDQVPDASRISPPRIDALHPDAAYFSIEGRLSSPDVEGDTASSPSHPLYIRENEEVITVELADGYAIPDRDFVLTWTEAKAEQLRPQAWRWTEGQTTYALVQLRAPEDIEVASGFAQDVYFLLDRSGSMAGAKWERSCEALRAFVELLGPDDRVWITLFESQFLDFAEAPMPAPAVLADLGFQQMAAMGTAGGTELLPAAVHLLKQIATHSRDRRASVILITDGQAGNEEAILREFRKAADVRVHTFGIDTAVNDAFLQSLARQQRGGCWLQTPDDDIAGTISRLGGRLRRPVLTDLSVGESWESARETWPDLHAREVIAIALRSEGAETLEVSGRLPDGRRYQLPLELWTAGSEAIKLLWAHERINSLQAAGQSRQAIDIACQYNLICQGAAFIAWDEEEQVTIAIEEIVQPAMESYMADCLCCSAPAASDATAPVFPQGLGKKARGYRDKTKSIDANFAALIPATLKNARIQAAKIEELIQWISREARRGTHSFASFYHLATVVKEWRCQLSVVGNEKGLEMNFLKALGESPSSFFQWMEDHQALLKAVVKLRAQSGGAKVPEPLIDELLGWVMDCQVLDPERAALLETFSLSLSTRLFSAEAISHTWRPFLERTVGRNSKAFALAAQWLNWPAESVSSAPVESQA